MQVAQPVLRRHASNDTAPGVPSVRCGRRVGPLLLILAALLLRVPGLRTDLWLDEIWALAWVARARSLADIFLSIHFDTNHWLYSIWLHGVGFHGPDAAGVYRLPAFLFGVLLVPLSAVAVRRHGGAAVCWTLVLFAFSSLLVQYSSEARGYAAVLFMALSAWTLLPHTGDRRALVAFWGASALGFLSHLTFVFPFFGMACLAWTDAWRLTARRPVAAMAWLLRLVGVPALTLLLLYWVDIRHMQHGGGPVAPAWRSVGGVCAATLGVPNTGWAAGGSAVVVLGVYAYMLRRLQLRRDPEWILHTGMLAALVAVVAVWTLRGFPYWTPRHFLVCLPFFLCLAGRALSEVSAMSRGRNAALVLLVCYLAGNGVALSRFFRHGRGGYAAAVRFMVQEDMAPVITVGSDHDFRTAMVLGFYAPLEPLRDFLYVRGVSADSAPAPTWYLAHRFDSTEPGTPDAIPLAGQRYQRIRTFPCGSLSGWQWTLYRRTTTF